MLTKLNTILYLVSIIKLYHANDKMPFFSVHFIDFPIFIFFFLIHEMSFVYLTHRNSCNFHSISMYNKKKNKSSYVSFRDVK